MRADLNWISVFQNFGSAPVRPVFIAPTTQRIIDQIRGVIDAARAANAAELAGSSVLRPLDVLSEVKSLYTRAAEAMQQQQTEALTTAAQLLKKLVADLDKLIDALTQPSPPSYDFVQMQITNNQSYTDSVLQIIKALTSPESFQIVQDAMVKAMQMLKNAFPGSRKVRILCKHSKKALDVEGASTSNGARIIQYDWHGGANQVFVMEHQPNDGCYKIIASNSGKVIDIHGASQTNCASVIQYDWHGGDNQRFKVEDLGDGSFRFVCKHSGKVLDITERSTSNSARVIQFDWHGGDNQRFLIENL